MVHSAFVLDAISERELAEIEASAALTENAMPRDLETTAPINLDWLSRLPESLSLDGPSGAGHGHFTLAPAELDGSPNYVCQGDWNLLGTLEVEGTFGWLRGVDLNHRPLGYEPTKNASPSFPLFPFLVLTPGVLAFSSRLLASAPRFC